MQTWASLQTWSSIPPSISWRTQWNWWKSLGVSSCAPPSMSAWKRHRWAFCPGLLGFPFPRWWNGGHLVWSFLQSPAEGLKLHSLGCSLNSTGNSFKFSISSEIWVKKHIYFNVSKFRNISKIAFSYIKKKTPRLILLQITWTLKLLCFQLSFFKSHKLKRSPQGSEWS